MGEYSCEQAIADNGLPKIPWIGLGDNQYLTADLKQKFTQQGTNDRGLDCRLRGFKPVQFVRQWHGAFPWDSHDPSGCQDVICGDGSRRELAQLDPDQIKYLKFNADSFVYHAELYSGNIAFASTPSLSNLPTLVGTKRITDATGSIERTADPLSGKVISTAEIVCDFTDFNSSPVRTYNEHTPSPLVADMDSDLYCLKDIDWLENSSGYLAEFGLTPTKTSTGWNITSNGFAGAGIYDCIIVVNRTSTGYSFNIQAASFLVITTDGVTTQYEVGITIYSGSLSLSNPNTSADVKADGEYLLSFWPLNDDALYPWRTDGIWQVAPLMSRDEMESNVSPLGFRPYSCLLYTSPSPRD